MTLYTVTDGRVPANLGEDDQVAVVATAANAAMWLNEGRPLLAFDCIEDTLGWPALQTLKTAGVEIFEVAGGDLSEPSLMEVNFARASAMIEAGTYTPTPEGWRAIGVLSGLVAARGYIREASDPEGMASATTRALLAGYGAAGLIGVSSAAMEQPKPVVVRAGEASGRARSAWMIPAAREAERLAAQDHSRTQADISRLLHRWLADKGLGGPDTSGAVAEQLGKMANLPEGHERKLTWPEGSAPFIRLNSSHGRD